MDTMEVTISKVILYELNVSCYQSAKTHPQTDLPIQNLEVP